jgi:hypothetical protein
MSASSLSSIRAVWYKRPWFLITVAVIVVVGISVITDLPHPITKAQDATAQNESIKQINGDIAPCGYAIKEAFNFYSENVTGKLTASEKSQVKSLLVGDQSACSFTSGSIYDLTNNFQALDTTAGKHIDRMQGIVVTWVTDDALAAIEDIQSLFAHPGGEAKLKDLAKEESKLSADRQKSRNEVLAADAIVNATLNQVNLPTLPQLPGT